MEIPTSSEETRGLKVSPEAYKGFLWQLEDQRSLRFRSGKVGNVSLIGNKDDVYKFAIAAISIVNPETPAPPLDELLHLTEAGRSKVVKTESNYVYRFQLMPKNSQAGKTSNFRLRIIGYRASLWDRSTTEKRHATFYEKVLDPTLKIIKS